MENWLLWVPSLVNVLRARPLPPQSSLPACSFGALPFEIRRTIFDEYVARGRNAMLPIASRRNKRRRSSNRPSIRSLQARGGSRIAEDRGSTIRQNRSPWRWTTTSRSASCAGLPARSLFIRLALAIVEFVLVDRRGLEHLETGCSEKKGISNAKATARWGKITWTEQ